MDIITDFHQRLCVEESIVTLWTMTDIAVTYRAASHLIPFGTPGDLPIPLSLLIYFWRAVGDILQDTVGQMAVRRLSIISL
jgi:hypothetical protein